MTLPILEYAGGKIDKPGAYRNVPMEFYHGDPCVGPSISSSGLRSIFLDSPKHYWNGSAYNENREDIEQTEAIILGRAAHHLLLGEAEFGRHFVIAKYPEFRSAESKQWKAEQLLAGLTVLTAKQVEYIKGMAESLASEPIVKGGILNGHVEISMFWQDDETGVWLKARPDVVPNESGDAADLKCVADVSNEGISRGLGERGYHQQAALVFEGFQRTLDIQMEHFTLVYVEQKRPHSARFDEIDPIEIVGGTDRFTGEVIIGGVEENRAALRLFKRCSDTGYWPGPQGRSGDGSFVRRTPFVRRRSAERVNQINQELAA